MGTNQLEMTWKRITPLAILKHGKKTIQHFNAHP